MLRTLIILISAVLIGASSAVLAAEPGPPATDCAKDLLTTGEYAALIRASRDEIRDQYEVEIARLRAKVKVLETEVERVKAAPRNIP